jgi:biopolymer transport protein ExbB
MGLFLKFVQEDVIFAIPLFLMSMAGIALLVWRLLLNMNVSTKMDVFLPAFQARLDQEGVEGALKYCKSQPGLLPRKFLAAGLETSKQGLSAVRRALANVTELEILPELNFLLPSILAVAKIATMVGLLGTVLSMTNVLDVMSRPGSDQQQQAGKMGLALFATALGLVTAIPLVFAHVLLKAWVNKFELQLKSAGQKLMLLLQAHKPGAAKPAAAAKPATPEAVTTRR